MPLFPSRTPALNLVYQPVVELSSGAVTKVEAFCRPTEPGGRVIDMIAEAERFGGIKKLADRSLDSALSDWHRIGRAWVSLSVNLSLLNLDEEDLPKRVSRALSKHRFDPAKLWFELDESVQSIGDKRRVACMEELRHIGVRFSADSFGSDISQATVYDIGRLPIGELKVDGAMVADADSNMEHRREIIAAVSIAKQLRIGVSAKGIERGEIAGLMKRLGCTYGQGYYFARPVGADVLGEVIDDVQRTAPASIGV
jgi:EAL domain-containing protein (putative c-di-GMP-specific phosphodiesterase class I)